MQLFDVISKLRDKGIDVNNVMNAVTAAEDLDTDQAGYEQALFETTGHLVRSTFTQQAKMLWINFVDQAVTQYSKTDDIAVMQAIRAAESATENYFSVFRSKIPAGKVVAFKTGTRDEIKALTAKHAAEYVRPASKQSRAVEILKANPTANSRELHAMFVEQLKLTPNGASTYIYNVRKLVAAGK